MPSRVATLPNAGANAARPAPVPPAPRRPDDGEIELAIDSVEDPFDVDIAGEPPARDSMEFSIEPTSLPPRGAVPPSKFSTSFAAVQPPAPNPRRELEERFSLGDFSGALVIAEALLADQGDDPVVKRITADCRARLSQMYQSRLGSMDQIPSVAVAPSELRWMSLDHRAGFVLSLIDGFSSIEELIDLAGMPALDVLRTLFELQTQRVIELKSRPNARR